MNPEKQIFWHQGLFLQPQHFQYLEQYQRSSLTPLYQYRQPLSWGTRRVEVNQSSLLNRVVDVVSFEAIFQDFSWVKKGENCTLASRSFADQENAFLEGDTFTVYIGLKKWDKTAINVSQVASRDDQVDTRFISHQEPVEQKDLYDQGPVAQVRFMDYQLKIFWQTELEQAGDYHLIPVACLQMVGDNIQLKNDYVPPVINLECSQNLMQIVKNIREQMLARCRVLETYKPVHGQEINSLEMSALYYLQALNVLNRYVAQIQHSLDHPLVHPWDLYGFFRQLVGELSTFSDRINGLGQLRDGQYLVGEYDHLNAGKCYHEIQRLIGELLDGIVVGSENMIVMTREDNKFWCEIPADILAERQLYCLMVRTGHDGLEVVNTLTNHVKTGSCKSIDTLVVRSLSGVRLVHREIPPLGIVRRQGCYCFELDCDSNQWEPVAEDGTLCLWWDQAPEDVTMELVVTRL